jgi:hypothetical protein
MTKGLWHLGATWVCERCYNKFGKEIEIYTIAPMPFDKCVYCGNPAYHLIPSRNQEEEVEAGFHFGKIYR